MDARPWELREVKEKNKRTLGESLENKGLKKASDPVLWPCLLLKNKRTIGETGRNFKRTWTGTGNRKRRRQFRIHTWGPEKPGRWISRAHAKARTLTIKIFYWVSRMPCEGNGWGIGLPWARHRLRDGRKRNSSPCCSGGNSAPESTRKRYDGQDCRAVIRGDGWYPSNHWHLIKSTFLFCSIHFFSVFEFNNGLLVCAPIAKKNSCLLLRGQDFSL